MPAISKIRFTNVVYEEGNKRYNDELFKFDGFNGAILLENGGGKTVFIQTALQAVIPHVNLADRKIKQTLQLDSYPAHVAIEWILSENPRRYLVTAVSLFLTKNGLDSYRYVYEYEAGNKHDIEGIPFVKEGQNRPADRGEISDYYQNMTQNQLNAKTFQTIKAFQAYIEEQYHVVANEWESIVKINSTEGGVEAFFDECKQTNQLLDRLLIPTVENAISGHEKNTFADTFDKHRASFKLYKELKKQIEENKWIEQELEHYVTTFERLHDSEQAYEQTKQKAKGLLNVINKQEQEQLTELDGLSKKKEQWQDDYQENEKAKASLAIQEERNQLRVVNQQYQEIQQALNHAKEGLRSSREHYFSLKLAELKQGYDAAESKVTYYKEQLEKIDEQDDLVELREQLDENCEALMGYFSNELEESKKRAQRLQVEIKSITDSLEQLERALHDKKRSLEKVQSSIDKFEGIIESKQSEMKRISGQILSNPDQEVVKEKVTEWSTRQQLLDQEIVSMKSENKQVLKRIEENNHKAIELKEIKDEKDRTLVQLETELDRIDQGHEQLKEKLATLRPQWSHLDSVYLKSESIEKQFEETLHKLGREKDNLFQKERLALRLLDDHGEQDVFFADPYLEQQIKQWSNQYDFLETGVQFVQEIGRPLEELNKTYPLWPMTLITTDDKKQSLKQKVMKISDRIQMPIEVLSIEEARSLIQDVEVESNSVVPAHWQSNQDTDSFMKWKNKIIELAREATERREEKERAIDCWKRIQDHFQTFIKEYPHSLYQEKREQGLEISQEVHRLKSELRELEQANRNYEEKVKTHRTRIDDYTSELHGLTDKLDKALRYIDLEKEVVELAKDMEQFSHQKSELAQVIQRQEKSREKFVKDKQSLHSQCEQENWHRSHMLEDSTFQKVKSYNPRYTNETKEVLLERYQDLSLQLKQVSKTRGEIEAHLNHSQDNIKDLKKQIDSLRHEQDQLDEELEFPPNGKAQMEVLFNQKKRWEKEAEDYEDKREKSKTQLDKQEQKVDTKYQEFTRHFPEQQPVETTDSLEIVKEALLEKAGKIKEQKRYLEQEEQRMNQALASIKQAFTELDRYEEAHHFKGPSVSASDFSQEDIQAFTYKRVPFVKEITTSLRNDKRTLDYEWINVSKAKDHFKTFCKTKVYNVKMREKVIEGIERKRSYDDVLEFQTHMKKRVQTAIRYAEESIISHDQQLEQFITHMHSHLKTITQELEIIPRKTKVKVEDKWKEIYKFSIPEWTEEQGKEKLRHHIEWILEQLEKDSYRNVEGHEDYGKVRKDIETWLQSKQLLRIVMNNEMIKVTCRKVTNDNRVTTRSYSWEQSNVWSGGEKWSKNMTLFLGILNYVAEKQKHIQTNMKRHRAVIMDNPFGKASSDHVLNPVFFIAEQLGFQIIALTAHAEGKFLRDYFPVIYSCRLRPAQDPTKQIMTKEKQLHQAYFQDHEPKALDRLGEVEQIELF